MQRASHRSSWTQTRARCSGACSARATAWCAETLVKCQTWSGVTRVHRAPRQVTVDSTKFTRWSSPRSLLEHLADELSKYTEWDVGQTESALPPEQAVAQSRFVHEAVLPFVKEYRATVQLASQQEARLLELQLDRLDSHIENVEKFDAARLEVHLAPTRTSSMDKLKMRLSPSGGGTFHCVRCKPAG